MDDFDRAIQLDPKLDAAYNGRSAVHYKLGNFKKAITDASKAIELNSKNAGAYNNRALSYLKIGNTIQALSDSYQSLEINPSNGESYVARATVYLATKDFDKCWKDIQKAQDLGFHLTPKQLEEIRKITGYRGEF